MRIVVHHNKFYDWEPVPADVVVTPADVASGRVKSGGRAGGYLMRVTKEADTHTTILIPEEQVIAKIIHDKTRLEGGRTLARKQAVAFYLSEHVLPHHAHRSWLTKFEVHDDGPNEAQLRQALEPHVKAGNIALEDVEAHVKAYVEKTSPDDHAKHLHAHFKVTS